MFKTSGDRFIQQSYSVESLVILYFKGHGMTIVKIKPNQACTKKAFVNTTYYPSLTLFAFRTNKKQYLDTLHIQKKKEMHRRMHNNDFDILLRSVHLSPKLQIPKNP